MVDYAGIGSRQTPQDVLIAFENYARTSVHNCRTGAAYGADSAFIRGSNWNHLTVYLPWNGYNNWKHNDPHIVDCSRFANTHQAELLAKQFHPCWDSLTPIAKQLMSRNVYILLTESLQDPVDYVICWTPDGATHTTSALTGGTGQAIRIANHLGIPVINYADKLLSETIVW